MKIVFLSAQKNAVSSWAISRGFSWEEGVLGVGSIYQRGVLPFAFEGFQACETQNEFDALVGQGHLGVVIEDGISLFLGSNAEVLMGDMK